MRQVIPQNVKIDFDNDNFLNKAFDVFTKRMFQGDCFCKAIDKLEKELETA